MKSTTSRPCITGMGVMTPIGCDSRSFWESLVTGRSGARAVRSFDTSGLAHRIGCEIDRYDIPVRIRGSVLGGRCTELALLAVAQAIEQAGLMAAPPADPAGHSRAGAASAHRGGHRGSEPRSARVRERLPDRKRLAILHSADLAVVVGTTMGDVTTFEQDRAAHAERDAGDRDVSSLANRPLDIVGRSIAHYLGARGPVMTTPAACAAGAYAIGIAASLVARGRARAAIAVGSEAFSRLAFVGFSRMHAMSPDLCRPFSLGRPGLLLGEGAGALVIEPEEAARARGAEPLGFIDGFGLSCDAFHVTGPHPEGAGAMRAMKDALARAGIEPLHVDYINAHGTGTPLNDRTECLAVHGLFGERARALPISSIKALTGHLMGAAGAVEAIACLLAIRNRTLPPTWNWAAPDPECDIDCVPNAPRPADLRHVVSNSYAFGGNNASLVLSAPAA